METATPCRDSDRHDASHKMPSTSPPRCVANLYLRFSLLHLVLLLVLLPSTNAPPPEAPTATAAAWRRATALLDEAGRLPTTDADLVARRVALLRAALALRPDMAVAENNLALALGDLGRGDEALEHTARAIALDPTNFEFYNNRATLTEDSAEAVVLLQRALALRPGHLVPTVNLGHELRKLSRSHEEVAAYDAALRHPRDASVTAGGDAATVLRIHRATATPGTYASDDEVREWHGLVRSRLDDLLRPEAAGAEGVAVAGHGERGTRGHGQRRGGARDQGEGQYRSHVQSRGQSQSQSLSQSLSLSLSDPLAQMAFLPFALPFQGLSNAEVFARLHRVYHAAHPPLASVGVATARHAKVGQGRLAFWGSRGRARRGTGNGIHKGIFTDTDKGTNTETNTGRKTDDRNTESNTRSDTSTHGGDVGRSHGAGKIRVGVLADFASNTSPGKLFGRVAEFLDRERFLIIFLEINPDHRFEGVKGAYLANPIRRHADRVVMLPSGDLNATREVLMQQGLDVMLFTSAMLTPVNYFLSFARVAPVQILFGHGHPVTSGGEAIDYFVSSDLFILGPTEQSRGGSVADRVDDELDCTEQGVLFDTITTCFDDPRNEEHTADSGGSSGNGNSGSPQAAAGAVESSQTSESSGSTTAGVGLEIGRLGGGIVMAVAEAEELERFGVTGASKRAMEGRPWRLYMCLQSVMKFHPRFDAALLAVLRRDRGGLVLLPKSAREHLPRMQKDRRFTGVLKRVRFMNHLPHDDLMRLLELVDVVLDPFPWGGGITSFEALSACTPIVVLPREQTIMKHTLGFMRVLGINETLAHSVEHYADIAFRLANDHTFGTMIRGRICHHKARLFRAMDVVREWEMFLGRAVRAAQTFENKEATTRTFCEVDQVLKLGDGSSNRLVVPVLFAASRGPRHRKDDRRRALAQLHAATQRAVDVFCAKSHMSVEDCRDLGGAMQGVALKQCGDAAQLEAQPAGTFGNSRGSMFRLVNSDFPVSRAVARLVAESVNNATSLAWLLQTNIENGWRGFDVDAALSKSTHLIHTEGRIAEGARLLVAAIWFHEQTKGVLAPVESYGRTMEALYFMSDALSHSDIALGVEAAAQFARLVPAGDAMAAQMLVYALKVSGRASMAAAALHVMDSTVMKQPPFRCKNEGVMHGETKAAFLRSLVLVSPPPRTNAVRSYYDYYDAPSSLDRGTFNLPVRVQRATNGWAAKQRWQWDRLPTTLKNATHFQEWRRHGDCPVAYVEERFFDLHPEILADFKEPPSCMAEDDITVSFGRRMKMSYSRFLVFSHAGGGTKLHKDAWGSGFWNTCVHGQKRWLFIRHLTEHARDVAVDEKWFEVRLTQ